MPEKKADLTQPKNFMNWALYGLSAVISTIVGVVYFNMRTELKKCQDDNSFYARESFKNILKMQAQEKTIMVQDTAITEAISIIKDSTELVNVKNFKGILNIKKK